METNLKYIINMNDFRITLATEETLKNPDWRQISGRTAGLVLSGKVDAKTVVSQILSRQSPESYEKLKEMRAAQNMKQSTLKREGEPEIKPLNEASEPDDGFDVILPSGGSAPAKKDADEPAVEPEKENGFEGMGEAELKDAAKEKKVKGFALMSRDELVKALKKA